MAGIEPYQYEPMASHNGSVDWSSEDDENFETQRSSREIDVAEWWVFLSFATVHMCSLSFPFNDTQRRFIILAS